MKKLSLLLLTLLICSVQSMNAQWTSVNLPDITGVEYSFTSVVSTGNRLLAGTSNGLYKSDNDGALWEPVRGGFTTPYVNALFADGQTVLLGNNSGVISVSYDGGTTWQNSTGAASGLPLLAFAKKGSKYYALDQYYIYISDDQGSSWQQINNDLPSVVLNGIFVKGSKLFLSGGMGSLFVTEDDGANWQVSNSGLPNAAIGTMTSDGTNLWVAAADGVYKSTNDGASWTKSWTGSATVVYVAYLSNGTLIASTQTGGFFISTNGGDSWINRGSAFVYSYITQHAFHNSQLFVAGHMNGIFRSADNAQNWTPENHGIEVAIRELNTYSGELYATGNINNFKSSDQTQSWSLFNSLPAYNGIECFYVHGSRAYIGTSNNGLYYSDNNGATWTLSTASGLPENNLAVRAIAGEGNNLYLATTYGVLYSTDNGASWQSSTNGLASTDIYSIAVHQGKVFAINNFELYVSNDNAQTWERKFSVAGTVNGFLIDDNKIYAYGSGINVSNDGVNFTALTNPNASLNIIDCKVNDGIMFAVGNRSDVYISNDYGTTWHTFSEGLPSGIYFAVRSIEFTEDYAVIATAGPFDVFRRNLSEINLPNLCPPIGSLTGPGNVCSHDQDVVYTITPQDGATFEWSVNGDASIVSGGNMATVHINFGNTNSDISVIQTSPGCDAQIKLTQVEVYAPAPVINGPTSVCENGTATYTIQSYPNSEVSWSATSGTTIATGGGSSVGVNFTDVNATISVTVISNSCTSPTTTYNVTVNPAMRLTYVNGPRTVCTNQTGVVYSVNDYNMANTQYTWTVPSGFTLTSGQGTQEIHVTPGATSGTITVQATNTCGTSDVYSFDVTIENLTAPVINGPTDVNANTPAVSYAINPIPNVTYQWSVPSDAVIAFGQGLPSASINFGSTSGNVSMTLTSTIGCGSVTANLPVTVNQVTRPTASARLSSCGDQRVEFYNLSGTFPLTVALTDYTYTYIFTLTSPTDNIRLLPANKTFTMLSVFDANYIRSQASDVSGTFTTPAANLNVSPAVSGTGDCSASMTAWGSQTGGVFEWYFIENDKSYTLMRRSPVGGNLDNFEATRSGNYVVAYRNAFGCYRESNPVSITLNTPPPLAPVVTPAGPLTTECGQAVDVTLTGPVGYPYYGWFKDGQIISGANTNTYRAVAAGTYNLYVSIDGTCYSAFSNDVVINQMVKPVKPALTGSTFYYCGKNASVSVLNVTEYTSGYFKWYKDGVLIPGANGPAITVNENGLYTVQGSKNGTCYSDLSAGTAVSYQANYQLSLNSPLGYTMACGASINLIAEAGFASYNWYRNGTLISGVNTNTLSNVNQSGRYEVEAVGSGCTTPKTMTDVFVGSSPSIFIAAPMIRDVLCGETTVLVTTGRTFYQWYKDGVAIPNSNTSNLTVGETGSYTATGSNDGICYSLPGTPVQVNVSLPGVNANISSVKSNLSCGEKATLSAMPATFSSYKWYKDGVVYTTTTTPTLQTNVTGVYKVAISNTTTCYSTISSTSVTVTANAQPAALEINNNAISLTYSFNSGNNLLQKTGSNSGNFDSYQWQFTTNVNSGNWIDINGATAASHRFTNAFGAYRLKGMFSGCGASYSNIIYITHDPIAGPLETSPAQTTAVMCRLNAKITATAGYQNYSWKNMASGDVVVTTVPEIIMNDHNLGSGLYKVTVSGTDQAGVNYEFTSGNINVIILDDVTPVLTVPTLACSGTSGLISISSPNGNYSFYEWKNSAGTIIGNTKELFITSGDTYTLNVADYAGCNATVNATVNASATPSDFTPVLTTQSGSAQFCRGTKVFLSVSNIASLPAGTYSYIWYRDGKSIATTTANTYEVSVTGVYTLQIVATGTTTACIGYSNSLTLEHYPLINTTVTGPVNNEFCIGKGQTFKAASGAGYTYKWGPISTLTIPVSIAPVQGTAQEFVPPQANVRYGVEITDANGCTAISDGLLPTFVNAPPTPSIYQVVSMPVYPPIGNPFSTCSTFVDLSVTNSSSGNVSYPLRWYKDGVEVGTGKTYRATSSGSYAVEFVSASCPSRSSNVQININGVPTVTVTFRNALPASSNVLIQSCNTTSGKAVFIAPDAPSGQTYTYKWFQFNSSVEVPNQTSVEVSTSKEFTPSVNNKFYRVEVTNTITGCKGVSSAYQLLLVTPPSGTPTVNSPRICHEGAATLKATGTLQSGWKYTWTDVNNAVVQETTSNTFTLPLVNTSAVYYVAYSNGGCASATKATSTITVHNPALPGTRDVFRCGNGSVVLLASGSSGTYSWFSEAASTNPITSGSSYTTPSLTSTKTYYVAAYETVNSQPCYSDKVAVKAIIKTIPVINIEASDLEVCSRDTVRLTASGADYYQWQSSGSILTNTSIYDAIPTTTTTYTAYGIRDGCVGNKEIKIAVIKAPTVNVTSSNGWQLCPVGTSTNLTASGANSYTWYVKGNATSFSIAGSVNIAPAATTDYVLTGTNDKGCSGVKIFRVDVKAAPAAPDVADANVCKGQSATLTVNSPSPSMEYRWYNQQQTQISTGTSFTTGALTIDKVYYVRAIDKNFNNCAGNYKLVRAHAVQLHDPMAVVRDECVQNTGSVVTFRPGVTYTPYTYTWYNTATGGTPIATNSMTYSATLMPNTSATYYVQATFTEAGITCISPRVSIRVNGLAYPNLVVTPTLNEICSGTTTTITASGASSYTWNTGAKTASISPTPANATNIYIVTGIGSNGCAVSRSSIIRTVPVPTQAPVITSDVEEVCEYGFVTFTATGAVGNQFYEWKLYNSKNQVVNMKGVPNAADNTWRVAMPKGGRVEAVIRAFPSCTGPVATKTVNVVYSTSLGFDGIDDQIRFPDSGTLFNIEGGDFSIGASVKFHPQQTQNEPTIVSKRVDSWSGYRLYVENGTRIVLTINGTNYKSNAFASIFDGNCHNIVALHDVNVIPPSVYYRIVMFYLDGVYVGSISEYNPNRTVKTGVMIIGNDYYSQPFKGEMHDVSFWRKAVSSSEIAKYNAGNYTSTEMLRYTFSLYPYDQIISSSTYFLGVYHYGTLGIAGYPDSADPTRLCKNACFTNDRVQADITNNDSEVEMKEENILQVTAHPNPFELSTVINLSGFESEQVDLILTDLNGREVWRKEKHLVFESISVGDQLNTGVYILKVIGEGEIQMIKIVKTK